MVRVQAAIAARPDRPIVLVDMAVPRDIEPNCVEVPGVTLFDIAALRGRVIELDDGVAEIGIEQLQRLAHEIERTSDDDERIIRAAIQRKILYSDCLRPMGIAMNYEPNANWKLETYGS